MLVGRHLVFLFSLLFSSFLFIELVLVVYLFLLLLLPVLCCSVVQFGGFFGKVEGPTVEWNGVKCI